MKSRRRVPEATPEGVEGPEGASPEAGFGNQFLAQRLQAGPRAAFDEARSGGGASRLPGAERLGRLLGVDLSSAPAHTADDGVRPPFRGATDGEAVVFASDPPSAETVAHEAIHLA